MTGFDRELHNKVLGFEPHVEVTRQRELMGDWRQVRKEVQAVPGVVATAPYVRGPVLVEANSQRIAAFIRGVDPVLERDVTDLGALMRPGPGRRSQGRFDLEGDNAVVGYELARALGLQLGDKLTIISSKSLEKLTNALDQLKGRKATDQDITSLREMVAPATLTVTGIFDSGKFQYDSAYVFVPFYVGQELYETEGAAHGVAVRTTDPNNAEAVKRRLLAALGPDFEVETWIDKNAEFFDAVRTERETMFVILFVVLIVAAFCVMNTLITVTVQKTREIGIMKAVGADVWQIVRVFALAGSGGGRCSAWRTGLGVGPGHPDGCSIRSSNG